MTKNIPEDQGVLRLYGRAHRQEAEPDCPEGLWRSGPLAKLNGISQENPYWMGDCLKVFDVAW